MANTDPDPYPESYFYMGVSARFMFSYGGNGEWANIVRGCLKCMYSHETDADAAHGFCYALGWTRTSHLSAIWGLGRAVAAAAAFDAAVNGPRPLGMN